MADEDDLWAGSPLLTHNGHSELSFSEARHRTLFSLSELGVRPDFDVAADGQRFVMIRERTQLAPGVVILVQNFFEELKAKVGQ